MEQVWLVQIILNKKQYFLIKIKIIIIIKNISNFNVFTHKQTLFLNSNT